MLGWETMSDEEAIVAAMDEHKEEARLSVAYCGLAAKFNGDTAESTFWYRIFMKLEEQDQADPIVGYRLVDDR